ncbi:hypothetical protein [Paraburkholderia mimosarum]
MRRFSLPCSDREQAIASANEGTFLAVLSLALDFPQHDTRNATLFA